MIDLAGTVRVLFPGADELVVESALLLFRSRGDSGEADGAGVR